MSYKYDICIIDYFPENWLKKSKKSIKCYDILKFGEKNRKNIEYFPMGHGIAQCDILLNFNSEAKVCVVPISPKTKINQVNIILSKLIRFKTSKVINISFGFFEEENNKHIMQMKKNCIKAEKKGIFLICARSNDGDISYPAAFKNVIKVKKNNDIDADILIDGFKVEVKSINFYVNWNNNRKLWVYGNSYYAPMIGALLIKEKMTLKKLYNFKKEYFLYEEVKNIPFFIKK